MIDVNEYLMQGDIPVGTRVRIQHVGMTDAVFGTVVEPDPEYVRFSQGSLFIKRDDAPYSTHTYRRESVEIIEEPPKEFYHVHCGLSADPVKVFDNLEKAREFRDGFNAALDKIYVTTNAYAFRAKITQEIEETQVVKVKKEVE